METIGSVWDSDAVVNRTHSQLRLSDSNDTEAAPSKAAEPDGTE